MSVLRLSHPCPPPSSYPGSPPTPPPLLSRRPSLNDHHRSHIHSFPDPHVPLPTFLPAPLFVSSSSVSNVYSSPPCSVLRPPAQAHPPLRKTPPKGILKNQASSPSSTSSSSSSSSPLPSTFHGQMAGANRRRVSFASGTKPDLSMLPQTHSSLSSPPPPPPHSLSRRHSRVKNRARTHQQRLRQQKLHRTRTEGAFTWNDTQCQDVSNQQYAASRRSGTRSAAKRTTARKPFLVRSFSAPTIGHRTRRTLIVKK